LYGAGFDPYVYVDLLAQPMTERQTTAPRILLVDHPALLELRRFIPAPVVYLRAPASADDSVLQPPADWTDGVDAEASADPACSMESMDDSQDADVAAMESTDEPAAGAEVGAEVGGTGDAEGVHVDAVALTPRAVAAPAPPVHAEVHADHAVDQAAFDKCRRLTPAGFDWLEPFQRLADALSEIREATAQPTTAAVLAAPPTSAA
ncbi:MAG: hypothetical protein ACRC1K_19825, partial [Planctomycetia bacterium]